jgi:uncharacterized iron-regulated membrane protein
MWRLHRRASLVALPFLLVWSLTGLVMLHGDWLQRTLHRQQWTVQPHGQPEPLERQRQVAAGAVPGISLVEVRLAAMADSPTVFRGRVRVGGSLVDRLVVVDPYRATVLGVHDPDAGVVALAERLHGRLNLDLPTVPVPAVAALFDDGPGVADVALQQIVLEVGLGWVFVALASGLVGWWRARTGHGAGLRRVHRLVGLVALPVATLVVGSGLFYSTYWSSNWSRLVESPPELTHLTQLPASFDVLPAWAAAHGFAPGARLQFSESTGVTFLQGRYPGRASDRRTVQFDADGAHDTRNHGVMPVAQSIHTGTQFGVVNRTITTLVCLALIVSSVSGLWMQLRRWAQRRRTASATPGGSMSRRSGGRSGGLGRGAVALGIVGGLVFPLWGVTALAAVLVGFCSSRGTARLRRSG